MLLRSKAGNLMIFKKWIDVPKLEVRRCYENAELEAGVQRLKFKQTKYVEVSTGMAT